MSIRPLGLIFSTGMRRRCRHRRLVLWLLEENPTPKIYLMSLKGVFAFLCVTQRSLPS
jgi:hypothetical protein